MNREHIFKTPTLKSIEKSITEWGGKILVRELTGRERMTFIDKIQGENADPLHAQCWAIVKCVRNEDGQRIFMDDDIDALIETQSMDVLNDVFNSIRDISGMSEKAVEQEAKN